MSDISNASLDSHSPAFKAGDIISFVCKDATFGMAKILKIDSHEELPVPQPVYHFLIYSLRNLFPPNAAYLADVKPFIPHLPIMAAGVTQSGASFIAFEEVSEAELESYFIWKQAFFDGKAGVFELSIDEAVSLMLEVLGKSR